MLSQYSLYWAGQKVIQQHAWKCHRWLQHPWALMYKKCEELSYSHSAETSSEVVDIYLINSCPSAFTHLAYSQLFRNFVDLLKCLLHIRAVLFVPESHFDHQLMIRKQCFYPHTGKHFLLPFWSLHYSRCQTSVLHPCVRSFCYYTHDKDLREGMEIKKDLAEGTMIDMQVNEGMITKRTACDTTNENELSQTFLETLAKILHCSVDEMKDLAMRYDFFTHLSPELIKLKVRIMVSFGLPYSFVSKNPRLLYQSSANELFKRLQKFQEQSFLKGNSKLPLQNLAHYLESRNDYFLYLFDKLCAERDALEGCGDQLSYLQFRLSCSKEQAEKLLSSYPLVRNVSNVRLKALLDFFLNEAKLSPQFVINQRGLLTFSVMRLRSRWKVIQSEGIFSENLMLSIWKMTQREFEEKYGDSK